jgi:hypothetical protein
MKRSAFKPRTEPMSRGTATMKRCEMPRSTTRMRNRRLGRPKRENAYLADLCHGQSCYLLIPGICRNDSATVVPAHSNQSEHGKGGALKADDEKTCPGCFWCHFEIDQGKTFDRQTKFSIWDAGYARWVPVRQKLLEAA